MLSLLLVFALFSQVNVEVQPLPKNELPPTVVKIDTPCDLAEKTCRKAHDAAIAKLQKIYESKSWSTLKPVLQKEAKAALQRGMFTGQIGFHYTAIAAMQLQLNDPEGATESYRQARKVFEAAEVELDAVLEILTPPVKTTGV